MPRWIVKLSWALTAALAVGMVLTTMPASAAPKARDAGECAALGNMAFVAGALGKYGIPEDKALELMPELYAGLYEERPADMPVLAARIVALAYRFRADNPQALPIAFGTVFAKMCAGREGDMDGMLGADT